MSAGEFVLLALAVTLATYGVTESRLFRGPRVRVFRWAYRRAGADFADGSWATADDEGAPTYADSASDHLWDRFVHEDDDPPLTAVLLICHWCTGLYASVVFTGWWALARRCDDWWLLVTAGLAAVVVNVLVHSVIARLGR